MRSGLGREGYPGLVGSLYALNLSTPVAQFNPHSKASVLTMLLLLLCQIKMSNRGFDLEQMGLI